MTFEWLTLLMRGTQQLGQKTELIDLKFRLLLLLTLNCLTTSIQRLNSSENNKSWMIQQKQNSLDSMCAMNRSFYTKNYSIRSALIFDK